MPKRVSILFAAAALAVAIAACNNGNSVPTPTAAPATSPSYNPKVTTATVLVTKLGSPAPFVPVLISTPKSSSSPRPGTPFGKVTTNKKGVAKFKHLKKSYYCWVATLGPGLTSSTCASWTEWQNVEVTVGT